MSLNADDLGIAWEQLCEEAIRDTGYAQREAINALAAMSKVDWEEQYSQYAASIGKDGELTDVEKQQALLNHVLKLANEDHL